MECMNVLMDGCFGHRRKAKSSKRDHPTQAPDLSNLIKFVEDALKNTAYTDDAQICEIVARKVWCENGNEGMTHVYVSKI